MTSLGDPRKPAAPSTPSSKVIQFADFRLSEPMAGRVILEYEDRPGHTSLYDVTLTCSGEGPAGQIYIGGISAGMFRVFRAPQIHRAVLL